MPFSKALVRLPKISLAVNAKPIHPPAFIPITLNLLKREVLLVAAVALLATPDSIAPDVAISASTSLATLAPAPLALPPAVGILAATSSTASPVLLALFTGVSV